MLFNNHMVLLSVASQQLPEFLLFLLTINIFLMISALFIYRYLKSHKEILSHSLTKNSLEIISVSRPNKSVLKYTEKYYLTKNGKTVAVKPVSNFSVTRLVIFKDAHNQRYKAFAKLFFDGFDISFIKWIPSLPSITTQEPNTA